MNVGEHSIPAPASSAAGIELDGQTVLLNKSTGALHVLNDAGAAIWARLDGSRPVSAIVTELSDGFGADPAAVEHDVRRFLSHLAGLGLLEPADGWTTNRDDQPEPPRPLREPSSPASWSLDTLWVDWYTAQVVDALRSRGIEAILLKGPAISSWLYRDAPGQRGYLDADLLVQAETLTATTEVLAELGFERERVTAMESSDVWAHTWRRAADGAVVDLHRTFNGCEHSTVDPWPILRAAAVHQEVGGSTVLMPSIAARAVQLVVVSPADRPWRKWNDLERALAQLPVEGWREAAAVARALGVADLFGYRLSQSPEGAACAARIGVATRQPGWLRWEEDPILSWVGFLAALPSWRERSRLARQLILPPPSHVRFRHPDAAARGLAAAYAAWATHVVRLVPGAVLTLLRSLRRARARG
jgi:predicted DCC family thiol-disulfide oxidoreductase YuxK